VELATYRSAIYAHGRMSAIEDIALSDEALEAWLAVKTNRRPLVRTMSALDGFVTAAVIGPPFPDPQYWICPAMGLPYDVLANGTELEHAVFASVSTTASTKPSSTGLRNMPLGSQKKPTA
jgi:hypothetical protein